MQFSILSHARIVCSQLRAALAHASRWGALRLFGNSPLARATIVVPLIGYFVLFNEHIFGYLKLHTSFCEGVGCEISWRLYCVYFGCCAVALASALYGWRCPPIVKKYPGAAEFFETEKAYFSHPKNLEYLFSLIEHLKKAPAADPLNMAKNIIERGAGINLNHVNMLAGPMGELYVLANHSRPWLRTTILINYFVGTGLLLIPTLLTFGQVLRLAFKRIGLFLS
jgi:hypothetical protein